MIAGLSVFALLVALDDWRKSTRPIVEASKPAQRLEPGRDWQKVMDIAARDIARVPELASIQARAALQIDAAEHAFNRMLAECASVIAVPVAPAFETVHRLARQPATPARQSLAA